MKVFFQKIFLPTLLRVWCKTPFNFVQNILLNLARFWSTPWQTRISHLCQLFTFALCSVGKNERRLLCCIFVFRVSLSASALSSCFPLSQGVQGGYCHLLKVSTPGFTALGSYHSSWQGQKAEEKQRKIPKPLLEMFYKILGVTFSFCSSTKTWGEDVTPGTFHVQKCTQGRDFSPCPAAGATAPQQVL